MKCPDCGADMNQHAEKIDYSVALRDPKAVDPVLGGVVEEFHTCPKCGAGATRRGNVE
jgi:ribosomal protein S27AE